MDREKVYGGWLEGQDPITALAPEGAVRSLREALEQEINAALGIGEKQAREKGRKGYGNGSKERALWLATGVEGGCRVPRGQYCEGEQKGFHSQVLGRYQRRARRLK